jgi:micrococcal nuclease
MRILFVLFAIFPLTCFCQLEGKVVSIADGDTFTMLINITQIRVRLHGIDCPEKGQDYRNVAKDFLSELVFGKTVTVNAMSKDRYGRTIGMVSIGGMNVNEALLKAGLAWHYKKYDQSPEWAQYEETARGENKGIWLQPNAIPPWEWRKKKK